MTVREYIGARYVPLFIGTWDDSVTYEPLSIVEYLGDSYTSRQFVPEGISITNTAYWALTGNYNAQIEQYRQEVSTFNERIGDVEEVLPIEDFSSVNTVKSAIDSIDGTVTQLSGDVSAFDSRVDTIETNGWVTSSRIDTGAVTTGKIDSSAVTTAKIADSAVTEDKIASGAITSAKIGNGTIEMSNLSQELIDAISSTNLAEDLWVFIGDSYAGGTAVNQDQTNDINKAWWKKVVSLLGITDEYHYILGSAGFMVESTYTADSSAGANIPTGLTYVQSIPYIYSHLNELGLADSVKHIVIQGGWNDSNYNSLSSNGNEVTTAVINALAALRTDFPNAKLYLFGTFCGSTEKTSSFSKRIVAQAYARGATYSGAAWGETANLPWIFQNASYDTVHPNEECQRIMAGMVISLVKNGFFDDYSAYSADGKCFISKNHTFVYNMIANVNPLSQLTAGADLQVVPANWSRTAESNYNVDIIIPYINHTKSNDGTCNLRYYNTGRMRLVNPSNTISVGDSISITPIFEIKFH